MGEQLRLDLSVEDFSPNALVITPSNAAAMAALRRWRRWPGGAMALIGPAGAGKSHMATTWAAEAGAGRMRSPHVGVDAAAAAFARHDGRLMVDDLDAGLDDDAIALLIDLARDREGAVLLVGRANPAAWPARTADLLSRLSALPVLRLEEPDLDLLAALLQRLARNRFLALGDGVARYLAEHMERSFGAAHGVIAVLDALVRRGGQPVSYELARRALRSLAAGETEEEWS